MTDSKISIRPIITTIQETSFSSLESFQNTTLRPIIKLQHPILIGLFKNTIDQNKGDFNNLKKISKKEFITNELRKNIPLRNQVIGIVVGMFTPKEFFQYTELKSDLDRRIVNISIERLHNSLEELNH
jgi:hypothetical protein